MAPSIPIPTDNIYKFICLFGLALIVSSLFSFVSLYSSSLESKINYDKLIIPLEAKEHRSAEENKLLTLYKNVIQLTKKNEETADSAIGGAIAVGMLVSALGAVLWYNTIQKRDDKLGAAQLEKLEIEIAKLRHELEEATANKPKS
jgi:hypothetical protein